MADEVWALADKPEEAPTQTLGVRAEPYLIQIGSKYVKIQVNEADAGIQLPGGAEEDAAFRISAIESRRDA